MTSLNNSQLVRIAQLMDAPGICFVDSIEPGPVIVAAAREAGTAILVSPAGLAGTMERLEHSLGASPGAPHTARRIAGGGPATGAAKA